MFITVIFNKTRNSFLKDLLCIYLHFIHNIKDKQTMINNNNYNHRCVVTHTRIKSRNVIFY